MSRIIETAYISRNNAVTIALSADTVDVPFAGVTRVDLVEVNGRWSVLSTTAPSAITWSVAGSELHVVLKLGDQSIPAGTYISRVVIYDSGNPLGVVWGEIQVVMKALEA